MHCAHPAPNLQLYTRPHRFRHPCAPSSFSMHPPSALSSHAPSFIARAVLLLQCAVLGTFRAVANVPPTYFILNQTWCTVHARFNQDNSLEFNESPGFGSPPLTCCWQEGFFFHRVMARALFLFPIFSPTLF
ncbi:hypothetical protein C8R43DRAFT_1236995 [Mycena crocata]|nr:hypothetical protein C8R43DRAFT_1236995 [Mycena crocata]